MLRGRADNSQGCDPCTASSRAMDPRDLARRTIDALAQLDVAALLSLEAQAESATRITLDEFALRELSSLRTSLENLLRSTRLSLKTLHALHDACIGPPGAAPWVR